MGERKTCLWSIPNLLQCILLGCKTSEFPNMETLKNTFSLAILHPHSPNVRDYLLPKRNPLYGKVKRAQVRNMEGEGTISFQQKNCVQALGFVFLNIEAKIRRKEWDSKLLAPVKMPEDSSTLSPPLRITKNHRWNIQSHHLWYLKSKEQQVAEEEKSRLKRQ